MTVYGYARVSSVDQDLDIQIEALKRAGAQIVRAEKVSATTTNGRDELMRLLDFVLSGDTLLVTRVDRLARSIGDLQDIVRTLKDKGVCLRATEQPFDTSSIYGELTLNLLGVFAQFETQLRKERQLEGVARAKERGVYTGGKKRLDRRAVADLAAQGVGVAEIVRRTGISRASVYRLIAEKVGQGVTQADAGDTIPGAEGRRRSRARIATRRTVGDSA